MKRIAFLLAFLFAMSSFPALAQQRVQMRNTYERLYLVVPMVGSGTSEDPRRPMYVPTLAAVRAAVSQSAAGAAAGTGDGRGIIAFGYVESDDGSMALVELVARDRSAFSAILADKSPNVKVFEKGKHKKDDIEKEFHKYKKDFDLDDLVVNVP